MKDYWQRDLNLSRIGEVLQSYQLNHPRWQ